LTGEGPTYRPRGCTDQALLPGHWLSNGRDRYETGPARRRDDRYVGPDRAKGVVRQAWLPGSAAPTAALARRQSGVTDVGGFSLLRAAKRPSRARQRA